MRRRAAALVAIAAGLSLGAATCADEESTMTTSEDVASKILSLTDAQFARPDGALMSELQRRVAKTQLDGIAVGAPRRVAAAPAPIPLVVACQQRGARAFDVPSGDNSVVICEDLSTHSVRALAAYPDSEDKSPELPPSAPRARPSESSLAAIVANVSTCDAAVVLRLPPAGGRYAFTVVCHDWRSNVVEVERAGPPSAAARSRAVLAPADPSSGAGALPSYLPAAAAGIAAPPASPGLAFTVEPHGAKAFVVRGALTVAAEPSFVAGIPATVRETDGSVRKVAAVVPVTLVVVLVGGPSPRTIDWGVPVYGDAPARAGEVVRAQFAFEVVRPGGSESPGRFAAWAVMAGRVFGTAPFRLGR